MAAIPASNPVAQATTNIFVGGILASPNALQPDDYSERQPFNAHLAQPPADGRVAAECASAVHGPDREGGRAQEPQALDGPAAPTCGVHQIPLQEASVQPPNVEATQPAPRIEPAPLPVAPDAKPSSPMRPRFSAEFRSVSPHENEPIAPNPAAAIDGAGGDVAPEVETAPGAAAPTPSGAAHFALAPALHGERPLDTLATREPVREERRVGALIARASVQLADAIARVSDAAASVDRVIRLADGRLELRLDPPELGPIAIEFESSGADIVRAVVFAEKTEALDFMRRHADALARDVSRDGAAPIAFEFRERAGGGAGGSDRRASPEPPPESYGRAAPESRPSVATVGLDVRV